MLVAQQVDESVTELNDDDVPAAGVADEGAAEVNVDVVPAAVDKPSITSPTPSFQTPPPSQDIPSTSQGRIIADMDAYVNVTLKDIAKDIAVDAEIKESADVQERQAESQAQIYQINLEHVEKVLSMQDDEVEPAELQEVVKVVTTAKLITEVVTVAKEPKPLRKQAQIEQDEAYARELEAKLNKNIDWDEVIDHVQRNEKEDNDDDIRLIFDKYFKSNVAFLEKTKEQIEEEDSRTLKRISETQEENAAKKQKLDEKVTELKRHL
nr:hypothetical protein [Tanacetum cinerariifolium]